MTRLRNVLTGAVVSCSTETAAGLGGEWQPVDKPKPHKSTAKKSTAKKTKD
ncbi:MAG: DUF7302 family protein [Nocardioidaceae bacterium]